METATPGVKSTADGWLNRYLQARPRTARDAVPRRRADAAAAARAAGHRAGARGQPARRSSASAPARRATLSARRSRRSIAAAADAVLNGTGREAFDAIRMLKSADPTRYQPEHGADYPRVAVRPGAAADRAAHQGRRRPRGRVRRSRRLGHPRQPGLGAGPARQPARRLRAQHRRAGRRPRRPDGRHGRADDVGVRPGRQRERQPRHRPRARQRHDGHRRRRPRRAGLRQVAGPRRRDSATRAATWPSPPTSATSSARSSSATSASRTRRTIFPGIQPPGEARFPGLFA